MFEDRAERFRRVRWPLTALAVAGVAGGVALGLYTSRSRRAEAQRGRAASRRLARSRGIGG